MCVCVRKFDCAYGAAILRSLIALTLTLTHTHTPTLPLLGNYKLLLYSEHQQRDLISKKYFVLICVPRLEYIAMRGKPNITTRHHPCYNTL